MQNQSSEKERNWAQVIQTGRGLGQVWKLGHVGFPSPELFPGTLLPLQTETGHPSGFPNCQQNYLQQWYDFTTRETGSSNKVMHSKALKRGSSHKETIWGEICKAQRTGCDLCIIVGLKLHCKLTTLEPSGCPHPQAYAKQGCLRWEL